MTEQSESSKTHPLEAVVDRIAGVRAARVVLAGDRVSEVHIVADTDRSPKQLVRDVQTAAKAVLDLDLDYRTVSVVQLEPADEQRAKGPSVASRLPLVRVVGTTSGQLASVEVVLREEDLEVTGRARGAVAQLAHLVARATLTAIEARMGEAVAEVDAVSRVKVGSHEVAVVVIGIATKEGRRLASGSAVVGPDPNDAIARATLDAVNRVAK